MTTSKKTVKNVNDSKNSVKNVNEDVKVLNNTNDPKVNLNNTNDDELLNNYIESLNNLNKLSYKDEGLKNITKSEKDLILPKKDSQSWKIYEYILNHYKDDSFTIYKVCKILNTPSNNTRRIYFKYFEKLRNEYLESLKNNKLNEKLEKLSNYYELEDSINNIDQNENEDK